MVYETVSDTVQSAELATHLAEILKVHEIEPEENPRAKYVMGPGPHATNFEPDVQEQSLPTVKPGRSKPLEVSGQEMSRRSANAEAPNPDRVAPNHEYLKKRAELKYNHRIRLSKERGIPASIIAENEKPKSK